MKRLVGRASCPPFLEAARDGRPTITCYRDCQKFFPVDGFEM